MDVTVTPIDQFELSCRQGCNSSTAVEKFAKRLFMKCPYISLLHFKENASYR